MIVPEIFIRVFTESQFDYALELAEKARGGRGDESDGDHFMKVTGRIAEVVVCDHYGKPRPVLLDGPDDGYDLIIGERRVDIKAINMAQGKKLWNSTNHKVLVSQYESRKHADMYLFTYVSREPSVVGFCGWLPYGEVAGHSEIVRKGEIANEGKDGMFIWRTDNHLIQHRFLREVLQSGPEFERKIRGGNYKWE